MVPQFAPYFQDGSYGFPPGADSDAGFSGFGVFLIRQFMIGAQRASGGGQDRRSFRVWIFLRRLPCPLVKPGIATLVIFTFVNIWNDFMGPLIYLNSTKLEDHPVGYPHVYFPSTEPIMR